MPQQQPSQDNAVSVSRDSQFGLVNLQRAMPELRFVGVMNAALRLTPVLLSLLALATTRGFNWLMMSAETGKAGRDLMDSHVVGFGNLAAAKTGFAFIDLPLSAGIAEPLGQLLSQLGHLMAAGLFRSGILPISILFYGVILGWLTIGVSTAAGRRFCTGQGCGFNLAVRSALSQTKAMIVSSAIAGGLFLITLVPVRISGWMALKADDSGITHAALTAITFALAMAAILVSIILIASWLLSLSAIAVDKCCGADALSRSISYCLSHRLKALLYAILIIALSLAVSWTVELIARDALTLVLQAMTTTVDAPEASPSYQQPFTHQAYPANAMLSWLVAATRLSSFLCGLTLAYLLLRKAEDGVQLEEMNGGQNS